MSLPLRPLRTPAPETASEPRPLEELDEARLAAVAGGMMTDPIWLQQVRRGSTAQSTM